MARKLLLLMLMLSLMLAFAGMAMAQTDDDDDMVDDDDDSVDDDDDMADDDDDTADDDDVFTLDFDAPQALEPEAAYDFEFTVYNNTEVDTTVEKGEWIWKVDLSMPTTDYLVDDTILESPDPIYGTAAQGDYQIDRWDVEFDMDSATISWQAFGVVTSATYGDIREQDTLAFAFSATTDADATDGFAWKLYGDLGTEVEGLAFIGSEPMDDDDVSDDDTTEPPASSGGDDDDDDSGGCGC